MTDPLDEFNETLSEAGDSVAPLADTLDELAATVETASDSAAATIDDMQTAAEDTAATAASAVEAAAAPLADAGSEAAALAEEALELPPPLETLPVEAEPLATIETLAAPDLLEPARAEVVPQIEDTLTAAADMPAPAMPEAPQTATVPPLPAPLAAPTAAAPGEVTSDDRLISALNWLGLVLLQLPLVSIVMLLAEGNKNRPFQRHHALQAIGFWVGAIVYEFVAAIVFTVGSIVTFGLGALCLWVIFFLPHLLALVYAWQAYQGKELNIPIVTRIMKQQGWLA